MGRRGWRCWRGGRADESRSIEPGVHSPARLGVDVRAPEQAGGSGLAAVHRRGVAAGVCKSSPVGKRWLINLLSTIALLDERLI